MSRSWCRGQDSDGEGHVGGGPRDRRSPQVAAARQRPRGGAGPGGVRGAGPGGVRARANHRHSREGARREPEGRGGPDSARGQSRRRAPMTSCPPERQAPVGGPGAWGRGGAGRGRAGRDFRRIPEAGAVCSHANGKERWGAGVARLRHFRARNGKELLPPAASPRRAALRRSSGPAAPLLPPLPHGPSACGAVAGHRGCGGRRPGGGGADR